MKPLIVKFNHSEMTAFDKFKRKYRDFKIKDLYRNLTIENHLAHTPEYYFSETKKQFAYTQKFYESHIQSMTEFSYGSWVVYLELKEIYHIPSLEEYLKLRTVRNRNLITLDEQCKLYNKKISVAGLSVGSNIIFSFLRTGIGNNYAIADYDVVSALNMNRANYDITDLDQPKVDVIERDLYRIDPYISITKYGKGLSEKNIEKFISDSDLVVDAFDNFGIKILLRKIAKKMRKPVLSGFDIERGSMVILERYDLEKDLSVNFYLNGISEEEVFEPTTNAHQKTEMFINIIGREHHSEKMLESVMNVGKTLTGYPQLAIATSLTSALWTNIAIEVLLGRNTSSIRTFVHLN